MNRHSLFAVACACFAATPAIAQQYYLPSRTPPRTIVEQHAGATPMYSWVDRPPQVYWTRQYGTVPQYRSSYAHPYAGPMPMYQSRVQQHYPPPQYYYRPPPYQYYFRR